MKQVFRVLEKEGGRWISRGQLWGKGETSPEALLKVIDCSEGWGSFEVFFIWDNKKMIKEYGWEEKDITLPFIPPTEAMIGKYRSEEKDKALEIAKKMLIEG